MNALNDDEELLKIIELLIISDAKELARLVKKPDMNGWKGKLSSIWDHAVDLRQRGFLTNIDHHHSHSEDD